MLFCSSDHEVDITGLFSCPSMTFGDIDWDTTITSRCRTINNNFSSIDGDPFKTGHQGDIESDSGDSTDSESDDQFSRYVVNLELSIFSLLQSFFTLLVLLLVTCKVKGIFCNGLFFKVSKLYLKK